MKIISKIFFSISIIATVFAGCKRAYDTPPIPTIPTGNILTISELKAKYINSAITIDEELSVYATATTDETSGNFYKEVYVQDASGAIVLRLNAAGGVYEGDSIRIYLKGTVLDRYNGMMQLSNVDVDNNIIKQATGKFIEPQKKSLLEVSSADQAKLITITDVEFDQGSLGATWANAITQTSVNNYITDCNGNKLILRTSGYSNFAGDNIPELHGNLTCIVGVYNADLQVYVRTPEDAAFTEPRCTSGGSGGNCDPVNTLNTTFGNHTVGNFINENCWNTAATVGTRKWTCVDVSGDKAAESKVIGGADMNNEMWMISPEINYNSSQVLSFQSSRSNWTHDGLTVWVSTNYNGSNASTANWTQLSATIAGQSDTDNSMISSGNITISSVLGGGTTTYFIGFKYNASLANNQYTTYRVDNIILQ